MTDSTTPLFDGQGRAPVAKMTNVKTADTKTDTDKKMDMDEDEDENEGEGEGELMEEVEKEKIDLNEEAETRKQKQKQKQKRIDEFPRNYPIREGLIDEDEDKDEDKDEDMREGSEEGYEMVEGGEDEMDTDVEEQAEDEEEEGHEMGRDERDKRNSQDEGVLGAVEENEVEGGDEMDYEKERKREESNLKASKRRVNRKPAESLNDSDDVDKTDEREIEVAKNSKRGKVIEEREDTGREKKKTKRKDKKQKEDELDFPARRREKALEIEFTNTLKAIPNEKESQAPPTKQPSVRHKSNKDVPNTKVQDELPGHPDRTEYLLLISNDDLDVDFGMRNAWTQDLFNRFKDPKHKILFDNPTTKRLLIHHRHKDIERIREFCRVNERASLVSNWTWYKHVDADHAIHRYDIARKIAELNKGKWKSYSGEKKRGPPQEKHPAPLEGHKTKKRKEDRDEREEEPPEGRQPRRNERAPKDKERQTAEEVLSTPETHYLIYMEGEIPDYETTSSLQDVRELLYQKNTERTPKSNKDRLVSNALCLARNQHWPIHLIREYEPNVVSRDRAGNLFFLKEHPHADDYRRTLPKRFYPNWKWIGPPGEKAEPIGDPERYEPAYATNLGPLRVQLSIKPSKCPNPKPMNFQDPQDQSTWHIEELRAILRGVGLQDDNSHEKINNEKTTMIKRITKHGFAHALDAASVGPKSETSLSADEYLAPPANNADALFDVVDLCRICIALKFRERHKIGTHLPKTQLVNYVLNNEFGFILNILNKRNFGKPYKQPLPKMIMNFATPRNKPDEEPTTARRTRNTARKPPAQKPANNGNNPPATQKKAPARGKQTENKKPRATSEPEIAEPSLLEPNEVNPPSGAQLIPITTEVDFEMTDENGNQMVWNAHLLKWMTRVDTPANGLCGLHAVFDSVTAQTSVSHPGILHPGWSFEYLKDCIMAAGIHNTWFSEEQLHKGLLRANRRLTLRVIYFNPSPQNVFKVSSLADSEHSPWDPRNYEIFIFNNGNINTPGTHWEALTGEIERRKIDDRMQELVHNLLNPHPGNFYWQDGYPSRWWLRGWGPHFDKDGILTQAGLDYFFPQRIFPGNEETSRIELGITTEYYDFLRQLAPLHPRGPYGLEIPAVQRKLVTQRGGDEPAPKDEEIGLPLKIHKSYLRDFSDVWCERVEGRVGKKMEMVKDELLKSRKEQQELYRRFATERQTTTRPRTQEKPVLETGMQNPIQTRAQTPLSSSDDGEDEQGEFQTPPQRHTYGGGRHRSHTIKAQTAEPEDAVESGNKGDVEVEVDQEEENSPPIAQTLQEMRKRKSLNLPTTTEEEKDP